MFRLDKLLIVIFILLIIITLGEIGYYFLFLKSPQNTKIKDTMAVQVVTPQPVLPTPTPNPNPGVNPNMIRYLQTLDDKQIKTAQITLQYAGRISKLFSKQETEQNSPITRREIDLKQVNDHTMIYLFADRGVGNIHITANDQNTPLRFEDLHEGDSILIQETRDLTSELASSLIELKIIKQ